MTDLASIEIDERDDAIIAVIHGDVDLSNIDVVKRKLDAALGNGQTQQVLDLSNTTFIDSVGIHLLFALAESRRVRRQQLRIAVPDDSSVARVLRLTDVPSVIPMFPDVASALAATDGFTF